MLVPEPVHCAFPGCTGCAAHLHHITYEPSVTKRLCVEHHEEITIINGQQARKYRRPLSNKHRWWIWFQWTSGKLKPRRTRKALEYTGEWAVIAERREREEEEKQRREKKRKKRIVIVFAREKSQPAPVAKKKRSIRSAHRRKKSAKNKKKSSR
jgi:hypothetical protein